MTEEQTCQIHKNYNSNEKKFRTCFRPKNKFVALTTAETSLDCIAKQLIALVRLGLYLLTDVAKVLGKFKGK